MRVLDTIRDDFRLLQSQAERVDNKNPKYMVRRYIAAGNDSHSLDAIEECSRVFFSICLMTTEPPATIFHQIVVVEKSHTPSTATGSIHILQESFSLQPLM